MAMQISGNYDHSGTDYAERVREKQAVERAAKETERAAERRNSGKLSELQDEYISSEKSGKKPAGLYRVGRDENGSRKIFFDDQKALFIWCLLATLALAASQLLHIVP